MFEEILQNVRLKKPLTHCITNYITTNDCANIVLACGASPTMAEAEQEAAEIASQADGLDINIGNLNSHTVLAMHRAIAAANQAEIPVVLDPVGAGASTYRMETLRDFFAQYRFSVVRGNVSELLAVGGAASNTKGVDAGTADAVTEENLQERVEFFKQLSAKLGAVVSVSHGNRLHAVRADSGVLRRQSGQHSRGGSGGNRRDGRRRRHCVSKNKGAGIGNRLVPRLSDGCYQLDGRRDITGRNER